MHIIDEHIDIDKLDQIARYWTDERIANARPVEQPVAPEPPGAPAPEEPPDQYAPATGGRPFLVGLPEPVDVSRHPYSNCGSIFFTTAEGDMRGSAALVGAPRVLLTAAHCVVSGRTGRVYRNIHFIRGFQRDEHGGWTGQRLDVRSTHYIREFVNGADGDDALDYAFCALAGSPAWNGHLGLRTGSTDYPGTMTAVGYPRNYGDGRRMYAVTGTVTRHGSLLRMSDNPFDNGASGGPWIINPSERSGQGTNVVNGLTGATPGGNAVVSPYFDDATWQVFQQARNAR